MRAIILAAGKGERLYPLTKDLPKCLIDVGGGESILTAQLKAIRQEPRISKVTVVTGYLSQKVEEKINEIDNGPQSVEIVYNPFFEVSNNLASLWLAIGGKIEPSIVINGDDLFHPKILKSLCDFSAKTKATMVIDRKPTYDDDDMKIIDAEGRLLRVGKDIELETATGESIGIIYFSPPALEALRSQSKSIFQKGGLDQFWLKAVHELATAGYEISLHEVSKDDWREMDYHPDKKEVESHLLSISEDLNLALRQG